YGGLWADGTCLGLIYPKPSISLRPSGRVTLGRAVTVQCRGRHQNAMFLLYKDGNLNALQDVELAGNLAEFSFRNVSRRDAGSYSCYYHDKRYQFTWSYPSDPVELVVAGEGPKFLKPTIWVSPIRVVALGGNVTIRCEGQDLGMEFVLRKAGHPNPQVWTMLPDGTGYSVGSCSGEGPVAGSLCRPLPARGPRLTACLLPAAEPSYPKPSISGIPSKGVSLGESVSIWCKGQHRGVRFVLNKDGRHFPPVDSDGFGAVFAISNVSREDGGSYSCSYHSRSEPFAVSYPSNPVELVVRGEGLGSASPFPAQPPARPSRGADVTIRCQGQRQDVRFFLYKAGDLNPQQHMDPGGAGAEFRIPSVGRQQEGNYSCSYRLRSEPFVSSQPSEPVKLVVAGEGPGSTSPGWGLLWPSTGLGSPRLAGAAGAAWHGMTGARVGWVAVADPGLGWGWPASRGLGLVSRGLGSLRPAGVTGTGQAGTGLSWPAWLGFRSVGWLRLTWDWGCAGGPLAVGVGGCLGVPASPGVLWLGKGVMRGTQGSCY
uniref:Ig-like domain-containing protein n=1 Tax=Gopherus evgoodei TaxID=1825980 RepID=A0A8C4WPL4_9SAUR